MTFQLFIAMGLSPHARGSHSLPLLWVLWVGSIPACAGEPWTFRTCGFTSWVYPRMRGGAIEGKLNGNKD